MRLPLTLMLSLTTAWLTPALASAAEFPIGQPQLVSGMEIAAVYLQPIEMEPAGMMAPASTSDIHLEADIHATSDNRNGFAEGDWMPNLQISYVLLKDGDPTPIKGAMMTMVASDGPHYGDNVKLNGPGKYTLTLTIGSEGTAHQSFGRHVDKETGVAPWPSQITTRFEFVFAGTGKKGAY